MNEVIVVIPIYKETLDHWEDISIKQCVKVLGHYPIVFFAPESLKTIQLEQEYGIHQVIRFKNEYFTGIPGYNRLMLSAEFYERFLDYTYLLIYQPDAFVFSDQLSEWCNKGYDYIGAPWVPSSAKYFKPLFRMELKINQLFSNCFSIYNLRRMYFQTGNGGLSLRRIRTFYQIALDREVEIKKFLNHSGPRYAEDIYWGIHVNRKKKLLRIPDYKESLSFAFEHNPKLLYELNQHKLPFGAHAWMKVDRPNFWKEFIPQLNDK